MAVLSGASVTALVLIGSIAFQLRGGDALLASIAAATICWGGAFLALVVTAMPAQDPGAATSRMLLSIAFRTALPFGGAVLLSSNSRLAAAGVFGLTVVFYLITLATETLLSLGLLNRSAEARKAS
ncbi:MAG: hypothetical protein MI757_00420 [Pirellulales bacterium]|nr:hypothetical protein [Pirellulales bacterium]